MPFGGHRGATPAAAEALRGRADKMPVPESHFVNGHAIVPPWPEGDRSAVFALGCFWGAERRYWQTEGVWTTAVGYAGGLTPNPTYEEVCSGRTGHTEAVLVVYDPARVTYDMLLRTFWESHDPTQGMRQGNDIGPQYRSAIFVDGADQRDAAEASLVMYQEVLTAAGYGEITTDVVDVAGAPFYYAEAYHQQYLAKNPNGYCGLGGTGISCPVAGP